MSVSRESAARAPRRPSRSARNCRQCVACIPDIQLRGRGRTRVLATRPRCVAAPQVVSRHLVRRCTRLPSASRRTEQAPQCARLAVRRRQRYEVHDADNQRRHRHFVAHRPGQRADALQRNSGANAYACVFGANGTMLRVTAVAHVAQPRLHCVVGRSPTSPIPSPSSNLAASRSPDTTAWSKTLKASGQPPTVIGSRGSSTSMSTSCLSDPIRLTATGPPDCRGRQVRRSAASATPADEERRRRVPDSPLNVTDPPLARGGSAMPAAA